MLHSVSHLEGLKLRATDGTIGTVDDFYFDDATWAVRYIVVDSGTWLTGRKVLVAPHVAGEPDTVNGLLPVQLSKLQVANSPDIDLARPVERAMEERLYRHYGWDPYWGEGVVPLTPPTRFERSAGLAGGAAAPGQDMDEFGRGYEPHLRSADTVMHYYIHARDGDIGHVDDFLVGTDAWAIRYMVVDTRNWLPGRKVLISPQWIEDISWSENMVRIDLIREQLRHAPEYRSDAAVDRDYETALFEHYRRAPYW